MKFVLDTSILITSKNITYPNDVFLSYWNTLTELANNGLIHSIDKVEQEIERGNDQDYLIEWKNGINSNFFVSTNNEKFFTVYRNVIQKMNTDKYRNKYQNQALKEFASNEKADAFLIAFALLDTTNTTIVTDETTSSKKSIIKIPDVCDMFSIKFCNVVDMLRALDITI